MIEEITAVRGLGVWTAHMFLIFHLEREDVLPVGDLGIRNAIKNEYGLDELPTPDGDGGDGRAVAPAPHARLPLPLGVDLGDARLGKPWGPATAGPHERLSA